MPSLRSATAALRSADARPASSILKEERESRVCSIASANCHIRTKKSSSFCYCRRKTWSEFALLGIAKRLFVGARVAVTWRFSAQSEIFAWSGRVASRRDSASVYFRLYVRLYRSKCARTGIFTTPKPGRFNVATFNCRTLTDHAMAEAQCSMNYDVLAVQETRIRESDTLSLPGGHVLITSSATAAGNAGVGLIVHSRLRSKVGKVTNVVDGRALSVDVGGTIFIAVYAPTADDEQREAFFEQLVAHVRDIPQHMPLVLLGDFNAELLFPQYGVKAAACDHVNDLINSCSLTVASLKIKKPLSHYNTFYGTHDRRASLDYVISDHVLHHLFKISKH